MKINAFSQVGMVQTICWSSNWASEWESK